MRFNAFGHIECLFSLGRAFWQTISYTLSWSDYGFVRAYCSKWGKMSSQFYLSSYQLVSVSVFVFECVGEQREWLSICPTPPAFSHVLDQTFHLLTTVLLCPAAGTLLLSLSPLSPSHTLSLSLTHTHTHTHTHCFLTSACNPPWDLHTLYAPKQQRTHTQIRQSSIPHHAEWQPQIELQLARGPGARHGWT